MTRLLPLRADARPIADLGERSAFVAGQRVGRARRRQARRIARVCRLAGVALGVAAVAAVLGFTSHWLLASPRFAVAGVDVRGASRVATERIREAAGIEPGTNVFRLRPRDVVARVEALPEVRRAEVIRELPDRVAIHVEERRPFTLVLVSEGGNAPLSLPRVSEGGNAPLSLPRMGGAGRLVWVDEEGRVIGEERRAVAPAAPLISGLDESEVARSHPEAGPRARAAIALIRTLLRSGSALSDEISEVDMGRPDGPVLRTMSGIDVYLGDEEWGGDEWPDRLARLEGVLAQVVAEDPQVTAVDLRFRDQVVLRRGGQPSDGRRPKS
ncbi:MAG: FtsQ-type POTRA domain-containing protein [Candidatus Rokubacteria bacterium]|nr:FtsQ-type POTRA domain-containing protein [Candidatus Rokubacteria bacterium]